MIIENKKVVIGQDETKRDVSYFELIKSCIKMPPKTGFNYDSLMAISDVLPLIDETKDVIEINRQTDIDLIKSKVASMSWAFYSEEFFLFQKYIKLLS